MALPLSIHAVSTWPISVDFDAIRLHMEGFSVEETVEHLLQKRYAADVLRVGRAKECSSYFDHADGVPSEMRKAESERIVEEELLEEDCAVAPSPTVGLKIMRNKHPTDGSNEKTTYTFVDKNRSNIMDDGGRHSMRGKRRQLTALPEDCAAFRCALQEVAFGTGASADVTGLWNRLLFEEITEQFSLFDMLRERYLPTPYVFLSCHAIPMILKDRRNVVEVFYSVDDAVLKLFLGDRMHKFDFEADSERHFLQKKARSLRSRKLQHIIQGGISERSLKRQWENLKRVSTFVVSAYRAREGMIIPSNVPLCSAIRRCFVLGDTLTLRYATFVFCYEHRLSGRCWERLSYTECASLCQLLSDLWCDSTRLMLCKNFCAACARIGRLLEDNRVVSEMHQMLFGEAMRPRWQVQLDEVQRAIAPNTMGGTGAALANPAALSPVANVPPLMLARNASAGRIDAEGAAGMTLGCDSPKMPSIVSCTVGGQTAAAAGTHAGNNNSAPNCTASQRNLQMQPGSPILLSYNTNNISYSNPGANAAHSTTGHNLPLSSNRVFSRRFLLEFPFLIKCLVRVGSLVGNAEQLQEALDLFYTRVYIPLENLSQRSSHVATTTTAPETLIPRNRAVSSDTLYSPIELSSEDRMLRQMRGGYSGDSRRSVTESKYANTNFVERASGGDDHSSVSATMSNLSETNSGFTGTTPRPQNLPSTRQQAAQQQQPSSPRHVSETRVSNFAASNGNIVLNDRPYLRELCMLLSMMPNIFSNLSMLSEDDHTTCDSVFSDFILTLKFMVQMCMASDHHEYT